MKNRGFALAVIGLALACCTSSGLAKERAMRRFGSAAEFDAFARKMAKMESLFGLNELPMLSPPPPPPVYSPPLPSPMPVDSPAISPEPASAASPAIIEAASEAAAPGADSSADAITNVQEAGVDEGGIVKAHGDFLVVLRRGRLFTVRHGGGALAPVDTIDAFPPNDESPGDTWYDEMLISGSTVVVIGYSYGDQGTEVSRFNLSPEGRLSYRDTHYLTSGDYYSSSNYASRLIGDQLVFYAPVYLDWSEWRDSLPSLRERRADGSTRAIGSAMRATDIYIPEQYRTKPAPGLGILHTVTRCDLGAARLACTSDAVIGEWSRSFYVSAGAAYVWTESEEYDPDGDAADSLLLRLPLDGGVPGAVRVKGAPIDQFSFMEDTAKGHLDIVLRAEGEGDAMWSGEVSAGDVALLAVPFDRFGNGRGSMPREAYRDLPPAPGYSFQNRFVGRHLLYAAADWGEEAGSRRLHAVSLDTDRMAQIDLPHGVTRLDRIASDGIAIGPSRNGLGFSAIALDSASGAASLENSYIMPAAAEGEVRSQAFFFRPDGGDAAEGDGTLGLPISRRLDQRGYEFLGSGSAMAFLRRTNRQLTPAGELEADTTRAKPDDCQASCVDWYGNARPIFLGNRIFALMGYEIVEGRLEDASIGEVRRVNFAP